MKSRNLSASAGKKVYSRTAAWLSKCGDVPYNNERSNWRIVRRAEDSHSLTTAYADKEDRDSPCNKVEISVGSFDRSAIAGLLLPLRRNGVACGESLS